MFYLLKLVFFIQDSVGSNSLLNENSNSAADDGNYSQTSDKKFGFLGLGNMGMAIVKNLIDSGHELYVWNRDEQKVSAIFYNFSSVL